MKTTAFLSLCLALGLAASARAALVENGASFTGVYRVQEENCFKADSGYGPTDPSARTDFSFEGTVDGLKTDGTLNQIGDFGPFNHGQGFSHSVSARYLSGTEFLSVFKLVEPDYSELSILDVSVDPAAGTLVEKTTTTVTKTDGSAATDVKTCHFQRVN